MKLFVVIFLFVGPVWSIMNDEGLLGSVLDITQCRASCLDQFTRLVRNEQSCKKEANYCYMCWEMCRMVKENFDVWGELCYISDVCTPGCQLACNYQREKTYGFTPPSALIVRTAYDIHTDRVSLEWVPDRDVKSTGVVLYSVLLKDENQPWKLLTQTTAHVVHIKRGLIARHTEIRVIAANATKQVSDSVTTYLGSHIIDLEGKSPKNQSWKPQLEHLLESKIGLQATVVWQPKYKDDSVNATEYEVSWSVADQTIEVTGHLFTNSNVAILTLWNSSEYIVQVNCFGPNKTLLSRSEPLLINTNDAHIVKEIVVEKIVEKVIEKFVVKEVERKEQNEGKKEEIKGQKIQEQEQKEEIKRQKVQKEEIERQKIQKEEQKGVIKEAKTSCPTTGDTSVLYVFSVLSGFFLFFIILALFLICKIKSRHQARNNVTIRRKISDKAEIIRSLPETPYHIDYFQQIEQEEKSLGSPLDDRQGRQG